MTLIKKLLISPIHTLSRIVFFISLHTVKSFRIIIDIVTYVKNICIDLYVIIWIGSRIYNNKLILRTNNCKKYDNIIICF